MEKGKTTARDVMSERRIKMKKEKTVVLEVR